MNEHYRRKMLALHDVAEKAVIAAAAERQRGERYQAQIQAAEAKAQSAEAEKVALLAKLAELEAQRQQKPNAGDRE